MLREQANFSQEKLEYNEKEMDYLDYVIVAKQVQTFFANMISTNNKCLESLSIDVRERFQNELTKSNKYLQNEVTKARQRVEDLAFLQEDMNEFYILQHDVRLFRSLVTKEDLVDRSHVDQVDIFEERLKKLSHRLTQRIQKIVPEKSNDRSRKGSDMDYNCARIILNWTEQNVLRLGRNPSLE